MIRRLSALATAVAVSYCAARLVFYRPAGALGIVTFLPAAGCAIAGAFATHFARYDDYRWSTEGRPSGYSYAPAFTAAIFAAAVAALQWLAGADLNAALWALFAVYFAYWGNLRLGAYRMRTRAVDPRMPPR